MKLFKKRGRNQFPVESKEVKNKNSGYIRLLKDLKADWPTMYRDDSIWNEYQCYIEDLEFLVKQGILFKSQSMETPNGRVVQYYKLGIKGFEYLFMRKVNFFLIIIGFFTILSFFVSLISIFIK